MRLNLERSNPFPQFCLSDFEHINMNDVKNLKAEAVRRMQPAVSMSCQVGFIIIITS